MNREKTKREIKIEKMRQAIEALAPAEPPTRTITQVEVCSVADYFSVYVGEPGNMLWEADFRQQPEAIIWAHELATTMDLEFHDRIDRTGQQS
jgi:hypothetical protein